MTTTTPIRRGISASIVLRTAALTTVLATAIELGVFEVARAANVRFQFPTSGAGSGTTTVVAGTVAGVTLLAMTVGWLLVALAIRLRRPTMRIMEIVGGVFCAASTLMPLSLNTSTSTKLTLVSLHLIAGFFFVVGVGRLTRPDAGANR